MSAKEEANNVAPKTYFVSAKDESARMFKNPLLHFFSFVHWATPMFVYTPLICYFSYSFLSDTTLAYYNDLGLFALGIFIWSFFEYVAHRFLFHYQPSSAWGQRMHFLLHGVHHDYPNDSWRLVMPPGFSLPLAILFYFIYIGLLGTTYGLPCYTGFVFGYVVYDTLHFALHHAKFIKAKWFVKLRKHHIDHHFSNPDEGFGVSSFFWDYIFGTVPNKTKK